MCGWAARRHSWSVLWRASGQRGVNPSVPGVPGGYCGPSQSPAASSATAGRDMAASRVPRGPSISPTVGATRARPTTWPATASAS
eukprot:4837288-Alexandrium_andersonii.AAC.1